MSGRRVRVVALGGTIAMTAERADEGVTPALDAGDLVGAVPQLAAVADVEAETFRHVPGAHLDLADLVALAAHLEQVIASGVDGVVITQGTDTLEETAFALDLLTAMDAPIVVTGAMRSPTLPGADGPANLLHATRVAASPSAGGCGVLVVLNETVHAARFVRKSHTSQPSAFVSETAGALGWVAEDRVRIPFQVRRRIAVRLPEGAALPRVALVTAALGEDFSTAPDMDRVDGVVVEALGAGHLHVAAAQRVRRWARDLPVVLASRTHGGEVFRSTYGFEGSERDLQAHGVLPAGSLDGPKARLLLTYGLAAGWDREDVREAVEALAG